VPVWLMVFSWASQSQLFLSTIAPSLPLSAVN
jgi:hypothetical protein